MRTVDSPPPTSRLPLPDSLAAVAIRPGDSGYDDVRHT